MTSLRIGDGGLECGSPSTFTSILSPTTCCSESRTSATLVPGKIRQLTVAVADWGNALSA